MSHKQACPLLFLILLTQDGLHPTMRSLKSKLYQVIGLSRDKLANTQLFQRNGEKDAPL